MGGRFHACPPQLATGVAFHWFVTSTNLSGAPHTSPKGTRCWGPSPQNKTLALPLRCSWSQENRITALCEPGLISEGEGRGVGWGGVEDMVP